MAGQEGTRCVIVGAGPVGALAALYAARRGWQVDIYEVRSDLRDPTTTPLNSTRSINLALVHRGITAMSPQHSGSESLLPNVLSQSVPLYGRMVHRKDALTREVRGQKQLYDFKGRYNCAVDRSELNKLLLDELDGLHNVTIHFLYKITGADMRSGKAWFESKTEGKEIEVGFDLLLGCDGAHSSVRHHMMKFTRMDYNQSYIDTLWCEFTIPPITSSSAAVSTVTASTSRSSSDDDGFETIPDETMPVDPDTLEKGDFTTDFAIDKNSLHIWPGSDKMFIAIPSIDKSFTCTLFAPSTTFSTLEQSTRRSRDNLVSFFDANFPGAAELVGGPEALREQFTQNPHLPLISIKCSPHHFASNDAAGVILGDAAHAMVPFYGQGMNAGLEDVRTLFAHLDAHPNTAAGRQAALSTYSTQRVPDAHAVADLALANYWDMRAGTTSRLRLLRKAVEEALNKWLPTTGFATQYVRVSFSDERYSDIVDAVGKQGRILIAASAGVGAMAGVAVWWLARLVLRSERRRGGMVEAVMRMLPRSWQ